ncbi:histidinol-phosphate transaminase [Polaromonas sp.]|uniref:histidinol-phosphate transaminase n=1 Tax=Polaromonas sp. TaxID=1869339 RepID=UPI002487046F|nr:histidinol-phosphate transaminase [Polaromonas sp.]MDI1272653.1 histidinol-phosphate transaminase [Polaromonas sp.]
MTSETSFWSPTLRGLTPYTPGEQPVIDGLVKLNTNENPYPPSPRVVAAIIAAAQEGLQLYPDPQAAGLRQAIADHHGIASSQVFAGNGSDEVLAHAFFAFFRQARPVLMPDISYSFYKVYCGLYGIECTLVPLDAAMRVQTAHYRSSCGGVVVANPNAPTGTGLPLADIEQLLQHQSQCVVLVDEAYVDFGGESAIGLIARYPNLLVVQTLSKSRSLAGLRVGFAAGQRHLIEALETVRDSFNSYPLDRLALAGAVAAYQDHAWFETTRAAVIASREDLTRDLQALGFDVLPSQANFLMVSHPRHDAAVLAAGLRERRVLVRHFRLPRIEQYLRISVGTPAQCAALVDACRALVGPEPAQ